MTTKKAPDSLAVALTASEAVRTIETEPEVEGGRGIGGRVGGYFVVVASGKFADELEESFRETIEGADDAGEPS